MTDEPISLTCSPDEIEQLKRLACSSTAGIWRIKRAKALLRALEGTSSARLMFQVRLPVQSIVKCIQEFSRHRMAYFDHPSRPPTAREAAVERMLTFLENPPELSADCWDTLALSYIGTRFTARDIRMIREVTNEEARLPLTEIARIICSRLQLYGSDGRPRLAIVNDILHRMAMDNIVFLPARGPAKTLKMKPPPKGIIPPEVTGEALPHEAAALAFVQVRKPEESHLWNAMIHHYHYIGTYHLFGPQLRYLVYCQNEPSSGVHSLAGKPLGALSFSSAAWRVSCRDDYIGWTDMQRIANLALVLNNSRFLILPWIQIPNLASRILGAIVPQVSRDWEARYGRRPVLLETFVERDRFRGTCYKAANWIEVGNTVGYSLYGYERRRAQPSRSVFLLPLNKRFRDILCQS